MADPFKEKLREEIQQAETNCLNQAKLIDALRNGGLRNTEREQLKLDELIGVMHKQTEDYIIYTR